MQPAAERGGGGHVSLASILRDGRLQLQLEIDRFGAGKSSGECGGGVGRQEEEGQKVENVTQLLPGW